MPVANALGQDPWKEREEEEFSDYVFARDVVVIDNTATPILSNRGCSR